MKIPNACNACHADKSDAVGGRRAENVGGSLTVAVAQ